MPQTILSPLKDSCNQYHLRDSRFGAGPQAFPPRATLRFGHPPRPSCLPHRNLPSASRKRPRTRAVQYDTGAATAPPLPAPRGSRDERRASAEAAEATSAPTAGPRQTRNPRLNINSGRAFAAGGLQLLEQPEQASEGRQEGRAPRDEGARAVIAGGGPSSGGGGDGGGGGESDGSGDSYILNFGTAVRILREDLPQLLQRPLQWGIYRPDVSFLSPWVPPLRGLRAYQLLHSVIRIMARVLYREASVELLRIWSPMTGSGGGFGGNGGGGGGTGGTQGSRGGRGGPSNGGGGGGSGGESERFGGGQLRVRWRAVGHPWLPWSEEERLEVVATYKFDPRGLISAHELTTVIPPEPPLLLWPLMAVARLLGRVQAGEREGGAQRGRVPIPGAGAGMVQQPEMRGGDGGEGLCM